MMQQEKIAFKFWQAQGVLHYNCIDTGALPDGLWCLKLPGLLILVLQLQSQAFVSMQGPDGAHICQPSLPVVLPWCCAGPTKNWGFPGPGVTVEQTKLCARDRVGIRNPVWKASLGVLTHALFVACLLFDSKRTGSQVIGNESSWRSCVHL